MRLCAKTNIAPRAFPYVGHSEPLVKIRLGAMLFLASPEEATDLARQLVAAVDKLRDDIGAPDGH